MGTLCTMDSFWICWQLRSTRSSSLLMLRDQVLREDAALWGPPNLTMPDGRFILASTVLETTSLDSASSACGPISLWFHGLRRNLLWLYVPHIWNWVGRGGGGVGPTMS